MTTFVYSNDEILDALQNSPVAGNGTYNHDLTPSDADTTVTSGSELQDAISSGASNIYCEGTEQINISNMDLRLNNGQTLYSNRGINGSEGALLYSTEYGDNPFYLDESNVRITGLRLRGGEYDVYDDERYPGLLPYAKLPENSSNTEEENGNYYDTYAGCGINVRVSDVEIDNCEIHGWGNMGINVYEGGENAAHIHHCYIHDCCKTSMGYGIEIYYARPLIEYNYFNATRHAIAGWGTNNSSFIVRDNVFGPANIAHAVDQHGVKDNVPDEEWSGDFYSGYWPLNAGYDMEVTNNTFFVTGIVDDTEAEVANKFTGVPYDHLDFRVFDSGLHTWDISIRGIPYPRDGEGILIENNSFAHDGPQASNQDLRSFSYPYAFNQDLSSDGYSIPDDYLTDKNFTTNFIMGDNKYDNANKSYDSTYGAPLNMDGAVTADFVVNAITEGGEWKVDGIPDVDVTLTKL